MRKASTLVLILLICSIWISTFNVGTVKAEPKSIFVPDDYSTIQEAVDNAPEGGTVFVRSGSYEERTTIDKPLSLIGENPENTIIEEPKNYSGAVIQVNSENVTITGFTIQNCEVGIGASWVDAQGPTGCKIIGNRIVNSSFIGIAIAGSGHVISGNNITGNDDAIRIGSDDSIIFGNIISGNDGGIKVGSVKNLTVYYNTISTNSDGLWVSGTGPFYVYGNNITKNTAGLQLVGCNNASVYENNIVNNDVGVVLGNYNYQFGPAPRAQGSSNFIYKNNFVNNQQQAVIDKTWNAGPWDLTVYYPDAINGTDVVSWYKDQIGNYWSDYKGADSNGDGIGDIPYIIDENNQDKYPLVEQPIIPEFPSWTILPILLIITLFSVVVRRKLCAHRSVFSFY